MEAESMRYGGSKRVKLVPTLPISTCSYHKRPPRCRPQDRIVAINAGIILAQLGTVKWDHPYESLHGLLRKATLRIQSWITEMARLLGSYLRRQGAVNDAALLICPLFSLSFDSKDILGVKSVSDEMQVNRATCSDTV
jgi:hypothetical protein